MYPWYRDTQIGVGQYCSPATIKTETGYNDCMLTLDFVAGSQSKVSEMIISKIIIYFFKLKCEIKKVFRVLQTDVKESPKNI